MPLLQSIMDKAGRLQCHRHALPACRCCSAACYTPVDASLGEEASHRVSTNGLA